MLGGWLAANCWEQHTAIISSRAIFRLLARRFGEIASPRPRPPKAKQIPHVKPQQFQQLPKLYTQTARKAHFSKTKMNNTLCPSEDCQAAEASAPPIGGGGTTARNEGEEPGVIWELFPHFGGGGEWESKAARPGWCALRLLPSCANAGLGRPCFSYGAAVSIFCT